MGYIHVHFYHVNLQIIKIKISLIHKVKVKFSKNCNSFISFIDVNN